MSQVDPKNTFYIVNKHGTIHVVDRETARERLRQVGYRTATKEEVQAYLNADGKQESGKPLAKAWNPEPIELPDLEEMQMEAVTESEPKSKAKKQKTESEPQPDEA